MTRRRRLILRLLLLALDSAASLATLHTLGEELSFVWVLFPAFTAALGLLNPAQNPRPSTIGCSLLLASLLWVGVGVVLGLLGRPWGTLALTWLIGALGRALIAGACRARRHPISLAGTGPKATRIAQAVSSMPFSSLRIEGAEPAHADLDGRRGHGTVSKTFGLDEAPLRWRKHLIVPCEGPGDGVSARLKRTIDLILALALVGPAIAFIALGALALVITGERRPFYHQIRLTQGGRPFRIYKLRTMPIDAEPGGIPVWPSEEDVRVTAIGKVLRRFWLDELPQIWNVLRGDLSWVGPRPERPEFAQVFSKGIPKYHLRHRARAGVTGLAQMRGFVGNTSLRKRLTCDLEYVRTWSPWLDLKVLVGTVCQLFVRRKQPVFDFVPGRGDRIP